MEPWVATVASSVDVEPDYEMNPNLYMTRTVHHLLYS